MNPIKLIADYLDKARSHIYGIFTFWIIILNLPIIFTAIFTDQKLIYEKTGLLKNEYMRMTFFRGWSSWIVEAIIIVVSAVLTYLMIWVFPKTIIAKAYDQELTDQYNREFKKIKKDEELEKKKQSLADRQLVTAEKIEDAVKKQDDVDQFEKEQWDKDFKRFSDSKLINVMTPVATSIYKYKGNIVRYYDDEFGRTIQPDIKETDVAIAHSNGLIELNNSNNRISLTEKGKYFLSQSYFDKLP